MANCENISTFNFELVKNAKLRKKTYFWTVLSLIMVLGTLIITNNLEYSFFSLIVSSFLVLQFYFPNKVSEVVEYGYQGEKKCLNLLSKLPADFVIFNQIEIPSEKSSYLEFETDFIVVGQNSIFIVEIKRFSGKIKCDDPQRDWLRYKYDKNNKVISSGVIKNPIKQVMNQKYFFCKYFAQFDLELNPRTIVFLDMDKRNYDIPKDSETPIFNDKSLIKYIKKIDKTSTSFINGYNRTRVIELLISLNENAKLSRKSRLKDKTTLNQYFKRK